MELKNFFPQDVQGNVIPSATAYLYLPGTTTLATGLQDENGAALSNPWSGSITGKVTVAAPDGDYDFRVVGGGRDSTIRVRFIDSVAGSAEILREDLSASTGSSLVGFIQSGASAVPRTAQSKLRESVSVKDFGAVGDGVTDDSAAIQAAINEAGQNATIYYPKGEYKISAPVNLLPQQHHRGMGAVFVVDSGISAFVKNTDGFPGRIKFSDMRFEGASFTGKAIEITNNTPFVEIENCYFNGFLEGVRLDGSYCSSIRDSFFSYNRFGVLLLNETHSTSLANCFFDGNTYTGLGINGESTNGNLGTIPIHNVTTLGCAFQNSEFGVWAEECYELHLINTYHEGNTKADLRLGVADSGAYGRYCYNFTVDGWQSSSACASGKNIIIQHAVNGSMRGLAFNSGTSTTGTVLEVDGFSDKIEVDYHRVQTVTPTTTAPFAFHGDAASRVVVANNGRKLIPNGMPGGYEFGSMASKIARIWSQSVSGRDGLQIESLGGSDIRLRADSGGLIRFEDSLGNVFFYVDVANNKVVFNKTIQADGSFAFNNAEVYAAALPNSAPGVAGRLYVDGSGFVKRN